MKFKGVHFPSFKDQGPGDPSGQAGPHRALPAGKQWVGFDGKRAQTRNLKRACLPLLKSKDPEIVEAVQYVQECLKNEPNPNYAIYFILHNANQAIQGSEISLRTTVEFLLKKYNNIKDGNADTEGIPAESSEQPNPGSPQGE